MTYGQFVTYPRWQIGIHEPFSEQMLKEKNFREVPRIFTHLRTFKYKVYKGVQDKDLRDSAGIYYKTAWDLALIFPMLEMTGGQSMKFMEEISYVYNMDNPLNDHIAHRESQDSNAQYIRQQPPYAPTFNAKCIHYEKKLLSKLNNYWITFYRKVITPKVYQLAWKKLKKYV